MNLNQSLQKKFTDFVQKKKRDIKFTDCLHEISFTQASTFSQIPFIGEINIFHPPTYSLHPIQ